MAKSSSSSAPHQKKSSTASWLSKKKLSKITQTKLPFFKQSDAKAAKSHSATPSVKSSKKDAPAFHHIAPIELDSDDEVPCPSTSTRPAFTSNSKSNNHSLDARAASSSKHKSPVKASVKSIGPSPRASKIKRLFRSPRKSRQQALPLDQLTALPSQPAEEFKVPALPDWAASSHIFGFTSKSPPPVDNLPSPKYKSASEYGAPAVTHAHSSPQRQEASYMAAFGSEEYSPFDFPQKQFVSQLRKAGGWESQSRLKRSRNDEEEDLTPKKQRLDDGLEETLGLRSDDLAAIDALNHQSLPIALINTLASTQPDPPSCFDPVSSEDDILVPATPSPQGSPPNYHAAIPMTEMQWDGTKFFIEETAVNAEHDEESSSLDGEGEDEDLEVIPETLFDPPFRPSRALAVDPALLAASGPSSSAAALNQTSLLNYFCYEESARAAADRAAALQQISATVQSFQWQARSGGRGDGLREIPLEGEIVETSDAEFDATSNLDSPIFADPFGMDWMSGDIPVPQYELDLPAFVAESPPLRSPTPPPPPPPPHPHAPRRSSPLRNEIKLPPVEANLPIEEEIVEDSDAEEQLAKASFTYQPQDSETGWNQLLQMLWSGSADGSETPGSSYPGVEC